MSLKGNPIRGRINAYFFKMMESYMHRKYGKTKSELFGSLPKIVVELGPGVGPNLRYYKKDTKLIAFEPNPHMHSLLKKNAKYYGIELDLRNSSAELLDLPDASVEAIVCTLVLCTVNDPIKTVSEIRRVLKPGGVFAFLEHVSAKEKSGLAFLQKKLHKVWHWFFEGCNLNRNTARILEDAGFKTLALNKYSMKTIFLPIIPHISGKAYR
ncbi:class I SAM-dependent methyltransferase [Leptospira sp. WS92.C1]